MIKTDHLSFRYTGENVLTDVSFEIKKNEIVAIIGPNGGGKTTLLQLLLGYYPPTSGIISISGESPKACRDKMGYVPQRLQFDSRFPISTLEVVLLGASSKLTFWGTYPSHIKKRAHSILEEVGLKGYAKAPFGTLSGGQMQRALIARSLLIDPEILFLDEATASIDPYSEQGLLDLVLKICKDRTVILVTHELDTVIKHVSKVICVQNHVSTLDPAEVCEHYVKGVYHPKLLGEEKND